MQKVIKNYLKAWAYILKPIYIIIRFIVYTCIYKQLNKIKIPIKDTIYILIIIIILASGYVINEIKASNENYAPDSQLVVEEVKTPIRGAQEAKNGIVEQDSGSVEERIRKIAREENFKYTDYLVKLAICESKLRPTAVNTQNNQPATSKDRGLFQINNYWHKEVSDEQAFDIEFATKFTMDKINNGYQGLWVCDKYIKGVSLAYYKQIKNIN